MYNLGLVVTINNHLGCHCNHRMQDPSSKQYLDEELEDTEYFEYLDDDGNDSKWKELVLERDGVMLERLNIS